MIALDYECECGEKFEKLVRKHSDKVKCPVCGSQVRPVPFFGGIQCDSAVDVKWLNSACQTLLADGERHFETRGEYKKYLKDKGIAERG